MSRGRCEQGGGDLSPGRGDASGPTHSINLVSAPSLFSPHFCTCPVLGRRVWPQPPACPVPPGLPPAEEAALSTPPWECVSLFLLLSERKGEGEGEGEGLAQAERSSDRGRGADRSRRVQGRAGCRGASPFFSPEPICPQVSCHRCGRRSLQEEDQQFLPHGRPAPARGRALRTESRQSFPHSRCGQPCRNPAPGTGTRKVPRRLVSPRRVVKNAVISG